MRDYQFYNYGCTEPAGLRRIVVPFRRLLRRLLRPMFERQVELYRQLDAGIHALSERQDRLERQREAIQTFQCDYRAMARRLAALEEHVEALLQRDVMPESDNGALIAINAAIFKRGESGKDGDDRAREQDCAC